MKPKITAVIMSMFDSNNKSVTFRRSNIKPVDFLHPTEASLERLRRATWGNRAAVDFTDESAWVKIRIGSH